MYMIFCYHQALKGYFYQCWKLIYISWMIIDNYISYKKSEFYEIVNEITKFLRHPLPVKCDFWNGLNNERYRQFKSNYHKFKKYLCTNFLPRLLLHISFIIKMQSQEKEPFSRTVFNAFNAWTPPCWILFSNSKDSIWNFSSNNLFTWNDV